ncbi:MAG: hypothetical protein LQ352_001192 [Teloschistes flavicans]|nr:MAG: hypothetical protein LQ352_001192 [Teloschistes flavicans]
MEELRMDAALDRIRSNTTKERTDGLADLKHIVTQNRNTPTIEALPDKAFHQILEDLFRVIKIESSTFTRAKSASQKTPAASRLSNCANVLRTVVEAGTRRLRLKTVKALLDHITQTLPSPDGGYYEPLAAEYFKVLRTVLEFPPHPEHLTPDEWHDLTDFCIQATRDLSDRPSDNNVSLSFGDETALSSRERLSRSSTPNGRSIPAVRRQNNSTKSQSSHSSKFRVSAEDVIQCLKHLASTSNGPILRKAQDIVGTLLDFIPTSTTNDLVQQAAFETINVVLSRTYINDVSLTLRTIENLIPVIRRCWSTKSTSLKNHMLVPLVLGSPHLPRLVSSDPERQIKALLDLVDTMREEYCRRHARDQLQIDDLDLFDTNAHVLKERPFGIRALSLRLGMLNAESSWSLLLVTASIIVTISQRAGPKKHPVDPDAMRQVTKRRKTENAIDSLLQHVKLSALAEKICALQTLCFIFDSMQFEPSTVKTYIETILNHVSDKSSSLCSWAMLAIASAAGQEAASTSDIRVVWIQVWRVVARHLTLTTTCRAACQVMSILLDQELVRYTDVADVADGMISSMDLNGPVNAVDSALKLCSILALQRGQDNSLLAAETADRFSNWLFHSWRPSLIQDRAHASRVAQHCPAQSILNLIEICIGNGLQRPCRPNAVLLGVLAKARYDSLVDLEVVQYLLEDHNTRHVWIRQSEHSKFEGAKMSLTGPKKQAFRAKVMDFLAAEISTLLDEFKTAPKLTTEAVAIVTSLCVVSYALLADQEARKNRRHSELDEQTRRLLVSLVGNIRAENKQSHLLKGLFDTFANVLPCISDLLSRRALLSHGVLASLRTVDSETWRELCSHEDSDQGASENNGEDFDEEFESQASHARPKQKTIELLHQSVNAVSNEVGFQNSLAAKLYFVSCTEDLPDEPCRRPAITQSFVDYIVSLAPSTFISCRQFLKELFGSDPIVGMEEATTLLRYIGQELLQSYTFERSELAMGLSLDIVTGLVTLWTNPENGDVSDAATDIYDWFITITLKRQLASSHVLVGMSVLLQRLIRASPDYGKDIDLPSARTSLFKVLEDGSLDAKFFVGSHISEIFGLFILKEHENILEDVIDILPTAVDWPDGMALRLYVLYRLAQSWPTLLRRCVYAILEIPSNVPVSAGHAKWCLSQMSRSLQLQDSRELFRLFAPQTLYTWLEGQRLQDFPFAIFTYDGLGALLRDVQDEFVGQITMRQIDQEGDSVARELGTSFELLVEKSIGKVAGYCIAQDVAITSSPGKQISGAEARLRKMIGKDRYASSVAVQFHAVLLTFFKSMDEDKGIERAFEYHSDFKGAQDTFERIRSISCSAESLPIKQQPSFKARYLLDQFLHLCRRTGHQVESVWSPFLYVFLFRGLLDTHHPALGSQHACSIIRKLRILISIAGPTALRSYPVEMALQSLRPFLTDTHCSEDTIGIIQYLLTAGESYLKTIPNFVGGLGIVTLISLKVFLGTAQESTTQESQYKATMSKANGFHTWLGIHLSEHRFDRLGHDSLSSLNKMIDAARSVRAHGNAQRGSSESDLLIELLDDEASGRNVLNHSSRQLIFPLLCADFEKPPGFSEDVLGSDVEAASFGPVLWKTIQEYDCGGNFRLWVGRVLGRAYASTGVADRTMTIETDPNLVDDSSGEHEGAESLTSEKHILRVLGDMLFTDDSTQVSIVEHTLRRIISRADETDIFIDIEQSLSPSVVDGLLWKLYAYPNDISACLQHDSIEDIAASFEDKKAQKWVQELCVALTLKAKNDPLLSELPPLLSELSGTCDRLFPFIVHLTLSQEVQGHQIIRQVLSTACRRLFETTRDDCTPHLRILLKTIIYLRKQPMIQEANKSDRSQWLRLDYTQAAAAAVRCSMFKTALLLLDISYSEAAEASRRASSVKTEEPTELLLQIYRSIDEQDGFYGVQQPFSLSSMMARLEYERAGFKSLSLRGAHYDSQIRFSPAAAQTDEEGMVQALESLDLNGLSQSLLGKMTNLGASSLKTMLNTARKLEQWDFSAPVTHVDSASSLFRAFQGINNAPTTDTFGSIVDSAYMESMHILKSSDGSGSSFRETLRTLAILTELDELCSIRDMEQLEDVWLRFEEREEWMFTESFDHVEGIISCRETMFSTLSKCENLRALTKISLRDARTMESRALLSSTQMSRRHGALQNALAGATYLNRMIQPCNDLGLDIQAAVQLETAGVLWDQGEMATSIKMLQDLLPTIDTGKHEIRVGKSELLAKLGHQIAEARLEKPDQIINEYLVPAIKGLRGLTEGTEAGQVFHEFASFCDQQLQNPDSLEDFERLQRLRQTKEEEVHDLDRMIKSAGSQAKEKENLKSHRNKAKLWFELDDREFQRVRETRQAFLRQSVENYLLALKACDKYDNDALRFSALWLQNYDSEIANNAVGQHITQVATRKFAPLMNQWSSRLLDVKTPFQRHLASLVIRICLDHPFHGMYQIFAGSKTKGGRDEVALGRFRAANRVVEQLKSHKRAGAMWVAIHNTNVLFIRFASEKLEDSHIKPGSKVLLRRSATGQRLEQEISGQKIVPPTMKVELRADCDYSSVARIARFQPEFSVASGISMPKIVTAVASDGSKYKQLFKSGNDDLRQDSIMEQVFEQVSDLLRAQRATRQRKLGIRTYKVLPLTSTSGIIEFVQNTLPLHDYLMPAHQRHFPKDMRPSSCRKVIADAQPQSVEKRIKAYRSVCHQFHPVLRYFFQERWMNPDDWFERRLAYTRSTAAISILGHILGLGDRHGHNILLDERTGEVVHIDLGIAFEQGRVLPVPEVVPFRLTRDVVDGMGMTQTEGVFRRCCEFTLEALRNEAYSIMTILDVLRYDPLYSWSLSPLRLKKLQEAQTEAPGGEMADGNEDDLGAKKKTENEPGEADRALTVVKKKLSKSLSVTATVNELIQQATDERNLALLFSGWAAAANSLVDVFNDLIEKNNWSLSYVIPISDNGGSSSEISRVLGGPGIGDIRSRLVRLIPSSNAAIYNFFNHRLASTPTEASAEFSSLLDLTSPLYQAIPTAQALLIRSILSHLQLEILKRTRPPSSTFNFQAASIGNLFLTGARLFSGSFETAIYLLAIIGKVDESRTAVLPAIVSNFTHHISAGLEDGTIITGQNAISHPSAPTALPESPDAKRREGYDAANSAIVTTSEVSSGPKHSPDHQQHARNLSYTHEDATLPGSLPTLRSSNLIFSKTTEEPLPSPIQRIWYINPYGQEMSPAPNPKAISAIDASDAVIYSIGSLYTSLAPNLILTGVGEAIRRGPRFKILILNGSLDRETGGYEAVDFVKAIVEACESSTGNPSTHDVPPKSLFADTNSTAKAKVIWSGNQELVAGIVKKYITHVVYIDHPTAPHVDRDVLTTWGIECVRLYGRKGDGEGGKRRYDEKALGQALGMVLGRRDGRERSRRNTFEGGGGK